MSGTISRVEWLGRQDSNLGMAESKSAALPLGYAPIRNRPLGGRTIAAPRGTINAGDQCAAWLGRWLRRRHDPDAIAVFHAHPIGSRQPVDPLDDGGGEFSRRQHRPSALAAWAPEALVDRMDADLGQLAGVIV